MAYEFVVNPGDVVGGILMAVGLVCLAVLKVQDVRARRRGRGA